MSVVCRSTTGQVNTEKKNNNKFTKIVTLNVSFCNVPSRPIAVVRVSQRLATV